MDELVVDRVKEKIQNMSKKNEDIVLRDVELKTIRGPKTKNLLNSIVSRSTLVTSAKIRLLVMNVFNRVNKGKLINLAREEGEFSPELISLKLSMIKAFEKRLSESSLSNYGQNKDVMAGGNTFVVSFIEDIVDAAIITKQYANIENVDDLTAMMSLGFSKGSNDTDVRFNGTVTPSGMKDLFSLHALEKANIGYDDIGDRIQFALEISSEMKKQSVQEIKPMIRDSETTVIPQKP